MNRSQLRILLWAAGLAAVGMALPAQAAVSKKAPAKAAEASKPPLNDTDLGEKFIDTGPGKDIGKIASPSPDALDAADTSALLDRRTEAAIQRGLAFLKSTQEPDGRWDSSAWPTYWTSFLTGRWPPSSLQAAWGQKKAHCCSR